MSYINVLISFIAISFVIFFHELGHFLFCRYFGVFVEVFSVGFGGNILSYRDKHNTTWLFGWITLGGYVLPLETIVNKEEGAKYGIGIEDNHPLKNVLIAFAGPLFNFLLSFFILFALSLAYGFPQMKYEVSSVLLHSPAYHNDFKKGDILLEVFSNEVGTVKTSFSKVKIKDGCVIILSRQGELLHKKIKLVPGQKFGGLGFKYSYKKFGFFSSLYKSFTETLFLIISSLTGIFLVFKSLLFRLLGHSQETFFMNISGTVGIINATNYALLNGWSDFLVIISHISVSLGACNLLPIPMLDGGQILIYLTEYVMGKKLNSRIRDYLFAFSLIFILALFVLGTFLDLYRLKSGY